MDKKIKHLFDLLTELLGMKRAEVNEITLDTFEEIIKVAFMHGLGIVLFPVLKNNFENYSTNAIMQKLNKVVRENVIFNFVLYQQISSILKTFNQENINPIVIKGMSIAKFYKSPEFRNMGDLDILVKECDWKRAKETLENAGYIQAEDEEYNPLHVKFEKTGSIPVELHRSLIHTGFLGNRESENWYKHIWCNKKMEVLEGIEFYSMSEEDELINQVTHFASHFVFVGTRLKHVFEMALIIKSCEGKLDWEYIEGALKSIGFLMFGKLLFSICSTFFNVAVPENMKNVKRATQEQFLRDLLEYFAFEGTKDDFNGWINVVGRLKSVFRNRFLLPLAWVIEAKTQYSTHGFKFPFIFINSLRNIKVINKRIKIIRNFGLSGNYSI